jgi:hypothetical protein
MKKVIDKSNHDSTSVSSDWSDLYEKMDPSVGVPHQTQPVTISYNSVNEDTLMSKFTDLETRLMKIELALVHVIPHVLEKLNTEN